MTMEMWWLGAFTLDPALLLQFSLANMAHAVRPVAKSPGSKNRTIGSTICSMRFAAYAVAALVSRACVLACSGSIERATLPLREAAGKIAIQAVPASFGAMIGAQLLGEGEEIEQGEQWRDTYAGQLFLFAAGRLVPQLHHRPDRGNAADLVPDDAVAWPAAGPAVDPPAPPHPPSSSAFPASSTRRRAAVELLLAPDVARLRDCGARVGLHPVDLRQHRRARLAASRHGGRGPRRFRPRSAPRLPGWWCDGPKRAKTAQAVPALEWVAAALGALIALVILGTIGWQALHGARRSRAVAVRARSSRVTAPRQDQVVDRRRHQRQRPHRRRGPCRRCRGGRRANRAARRSIMCPAMARRTAALILRRSRAGPARSAGHRLRASLRRGRARAKRGMTVAALIDAARPLRAEGRADRSGRHRAVADRLARALERRAPAHPRSRHRPRKSPRWSRSPREHRRAARAAGRQHLDGRRRDPAGRRLGADPLAAADEPHPRRSTPGHAPSPRPG